VRRIDTGVAVIKRRARCTDAAMVTATLDVDGQATALVGGRLNRDGGQTPTGWLRVAGNRLVITDSPGGGTEIAAVTLGQPRWLLYDFDFVDLIAAPRPEILLRRDFSVDLPRVMVGDGGLSFRNLGALHFGYAGQQRGSRSSRLRYRLDGPALAGGNGEAWFDTASGRLIEARLPMPNHTEYRDFRLRFVGEEKNDGAWQKLVRRHWRGCPAN
jgi:hypothetical protein